MMHCGLELACRLEMAETRNGVACADAHERINSQIEGTVIEVGGGSAIFVGAESPLSHAVGMGMKRPVRAEEIGRMEEFYRERGAAPSVELCPLADASLVELLANRGYVPLEFNNVLVRTMVGATFAPEETVRLAFADEEHIWAHTVGRGFLEKDDLTPDETDVGRAIWHMPDSRCYLAFGAGRAAAAAAISMHSGLATLFADSTLLGFRGAGLHGALIRERLRAAAESGCDLATASTLPGSGSQRNYERHGFRVVYTKVMLARIDS